MTEQGQDRSSVQRRAATGAMWTMIHTFASLPIAVVVNIVLARVLGVVDYGRLALLTVTIGIISVIVVSGVDSAMIQFGSKAHARGEINEARRLLSQVQGFRLLVLAPVSSLAVLLLIDVPPTLLVLALIFGVWVPAGLSGAKVSLTLEQRSDVDAKLQLVGSMFLQVAVVTMVLLVSTADAVWATRVVGAGLILLAALPLVDPRYRRALLRPGNPLKLGRPFWRFALQSGGSAIIGSLILSRSEIFLLEAFSDPVQVGLFAMAFGLAGHMLAPAQALLNPIRPAVAALAETDAEVVGAAFRRLVRVLSSLTALLVAIGSPALAILTPLIYGSEYAAAAPLIMVLVATSSVLLLTFPMQAFVLARLRAGSILRMNIVSLGVAILIAVPGVIMFGAWGAVASKLAIVLTRLAYLLLGERSSFETPARTALRDMRPLLLGVVCAWAGWAVGHTTDGIILGSVLSASTGGILFLLLLHLSRSGLTSDDARATVTSLPKAVARPASMGVRLVTRREAT